MEAKEKLEKARAGLILDEPFFGAIAIRLKMEEDKTCQTIWTDGITLGYNPAFVDSYSLDELKGSLCHEDLHIANEHHLRRQNRDHELWNIACDHAINPLIVKAGQVLPNGALMGFGKDESAEAVYSFLSQQKQQNKQEPEKKKGDDKDKKKSKDPGGCGEVRDLLGQSGKSATASELSEASAKVKVVLAQAMATAKAAGKMPADLERQIKNIVEAKAPWRETLRRFFDQTCKNDYSWSHMNRRYIASGLYLPTLYSKQMNPIILAVDTSGSITQPLIDQFAAEASSILEESKAEMTVMYVDVKIAAIEEFSIDNLPIKLMPKGGGGTSFIPPFKKAEEKKLAPSCLIYLTDGYCNSYPSPPDYPVLWAVIRNDNFKPPFGEVIHIK